jgi:hypothetical protein
MTLVSLNRVGVLIPLLVNFVILGTLLPFHNPVERPFRSWIHTERSFLLV